MKTSEWVSYFLANRCNRPEPQWDLPFPEGPAVAAQLAKSLSHFQLGESGGGSFLLFEAGRLYAEDLAYIEALRLFVAEEQEHARLLSRLVERFGGNLIQHHWTHALFRTVRRALGVRFELQVLVIAELVGTAYYRLLQRRVRDVATEQVCTLVLQDEARHIEFHLDRFQHDQSSWLPIERDVWTLQFQALFVAAAHVAWIDHRAALEAIGGSKREFFREARKEAVCFLASLHAAAGANAAAVQSTRSHHAVNVTATLS